MKFFKVILTLAVSLGLTQNPNPNETQSKMPVSKLSTGTKNILSVKNLHVEEMSSFHLRRVFLV